MTEGGPVAPAARAEPGPEPVLAALRRATQAAHERLEARLDILAGLSDPARRPVLVLRFWRLHAGAERALAPVLGEVPGLDYPGRRKAARLEADLAALGRSPDGQGAPVPAMSRAAALGTLYVLEGSTLGGRTIARAMAAAGQSLTGLSFFEGYGSDTGARWRSFLGVLEREAERGGHSVRHEVVRGALAGFALAEHWLCGDPPEWTDKLS